MKLSHRLPPRHLVDALLEAGLSAHRQGLRLVWPGTKHPRLAKWLERPWLATTLGALGDALPQHLRQGEALQLLLGWALSQLRPDRQSGLDDIAPQAWLQSPSWRPLLALACHHGWLTVPAFPSHYRRRPEEGPVDNLCGLWSVGPSTLYRYMDKGRRQLADVFLTRDPSGQALLSLRAHVLAWLMRQPAPPEGWSAWHRHQAEAAETEGRAVDALWHLRCAGDLDRSLTLLRQHGLPLAGSEETDLMLASWGEQHAKGPVAVELALGQATLYRHRHDEPRENEQLQRALRLASAAGSEWLCGRAYAAFGRFYEVRDMDRSFACYRDATRHLQRAAQDSSHPEYLPALAEYAAALVHLAFLHLRRNDARALPLLEQASRLAQSSPMPDAVLGELEQSWGEYWRCNGDLARALEHKHRALNLFERLGDTRAQLTTWSNLCLLYGEARQIERARDYAEKVLTAAAHSAVEPEMVAAVHGNLGGAYFYQGDLDLAIQHNLASVQVAEQAGLQRLLMVGHYNLAEAYYHRFARLANAADEAAGDQHAALATRLSLEGNLAAQASASRNLKQEVLGQAGAVDRLVPEQFVDYLDEMAEVQRLRRDLAMPTSPAEQVRLRLAIAQIYLGIATAEREAALSLAAAHGLTQDFSATLSDLRQTFDRALSREEAVAAQWERAAGDLLTQEGQVKVLQRLFSAGSVNKSAYAELAALGLATASKHLGLLAERGLLVQTGKGPATRYLLPQD